jgi:lysophospholipase L1-like esterase
MKNYLLAFVLALGICGAEPANAQARPPFWNDVQTIRNYDRMYEPPANPILFVGSSSIRKWNDLERTFAGYVVMNRGIGGAVVNDITYYLDDIVLPYHPRQIVIYVGENDLPQETTTADTVLARTKILIRGIRARLPDVPIVYISMKPSPSRDQWREKCKTANALIHSWIAGEKKIAYVDVFSLMLDEAGKSRPELFVQDMLHMNEKGYAIWRAAVEPQLLRK